MTFKTNLFFTVMLSVMIFSHAHAVDKTNECDRLQKQGADKSIVEECINQEGKSEAYLKAEERKLKDEKAKEDEAAAQEARKDNFITETFDKSSKEFRSITYGAPLVARINFYKGENKDAKIDKIEVATSGDDVCKSLGFQKASEVSLSKELPAGRISKEGKSVVLKIRSGKPERNLFADEDKKAMHMVRTLESITCKKVKSNEIAGMDEELKKIKEIVSSDNVVKNKDNKNDDEVDDGPRTIGDTETTPHGYKSSHQENNNRVRGQ